MLFWLNILAERRQSVADIVNEHWKKFGRNYYTRHDYEAISTDIAKELMNNLEQQLPSLVGKDFSQYRVSYADNFSYSDPIDKSISNNQGIRIGFTDGARIIFRLSGTGTDGATLRVYIEKYQAKQDQLQLDTQDALTELISLADKIAEITQRTGRTEPTVIT